MQEIKKIVSTVSKCKFSKLSGLSRATVDSLLDGNNVEVDTFRIFYKTVLKIAPEKENVVTSEITKEFFR